MVNPNETTIPMLLKKRGYESALFGKFHLGIQSNDPYGDAMVPPLGFDYYEGWLDATGDPSSIDTTAGGVAPLGTWGRADSCKMRHTGAQTQARATRAMAVVRWSPNPKRKRRGESAAIRVASLIRTTRAPVRCPGTSTSAPLIRALRVPASGRSGGRDPLLVPTTDIRARTFRGIEPVDAAIAWVQQQPANQPWMVTLSFASIHLPVMQPPVQILPRAEPDSSNLNCAQVGDQRVIRK
jgi:hypothetical protein